MEANSKINYRSIKSRSQSDNHAIFHFSQDKGSFECVDVETLNTKMTVRSFEKFRSGHDDVRDDGK